jgi:hypothetical protein
VDTLLNQIMADSVTHFSKWRVGIPQGTHGGVVRRVYIIDPIGGAGYQAQLSLRYEQSEIPEGLAEDSLMLYRSQTYQEVLALRSGWNMISLPVTMANTIRTTLFPTAISDAYTYTTSYVSEDTLRTGVGYWLKYSVPSSVALSGIPLQAETVFVQQGWNMIGSISEPLPIHHVISEPGNLSTSSFFGYDGIYQTTDTLWPGKGCWVKVSGAGQLILAAGTEGSQLNRIRILPTDEMPPLPPNDSLSTTLLPLIYGLEQNYPNPFNPVTTMRYQLPVLSQVRLTVYNVLGQVISIIRNELQQGGYKSVEWNAMGVASGVYFYKLEATSVTDPSKTFTSVKKMLLVK